MTGYTTFKRWQRIEAHAETLGFRIGNPKHGHWGDATAQDTVSIYPKEGALPTYTRDAEIFSGTFRELEVFLHGWERAQQYDMLLRLSDEKKRKKYEDKERERQRLAQERIEKKQMWATLKGDEAEVCSLEHI